MWYRRAALCAVLVTCATRAPALAATILGSATLQATPMNGAALSLNFTQTPRFTVNGQGTPEITITFADSQAPQPPVLQGAGGVKGVDFSQSGSSLVVRLHLTSALQVGVNQQGARIVVAIVGNAPTIPSPVAYGQFGAPAPSFAAPAPIAGQMTQIIALKYADVSEIVGVLVSGQSISPNDTFTAQPSSLGSPLGSSGTNFGGIGGSTGTFGPVTPAQNFGAGPFGSGASQSVGQRITDTIAVDRRLNAVILTGTPAQLAGMRETIDRLDIPLPSVLLETQIVELTDTAAKDAGIDFSTNGNVLAASSGQFKTGSGPAFALNLQATIYALVQRGGGRILARPQILAQSGSSASILTGDAIPIVTNITFAGSSPVVQQQVQYVNVGVNLQIQPRITNDGYVTSHIYSEVSSVTGYTQTYPQISQRVATTSATVRDGESFVIGGLVQENEIDNLSKVPGLGDIPLIGGLFRTRHDSRTRTNLYIVVTPRITQRGTAVINQPQPQ